MVRVRVMCMIRSATLVITSLIDLIAHDTDDWWGRGSAALNE